MRDISRRLNNNFSFSKVVTRDNFGGIYLDYSGSICSYYHSSATSVLTPFNKTQQAQRKFVQLQRERSAVYNILKARNRKCYESDNEDSGITIDSVTTELIETSNLVSAKMNTKTKQVAKHGEKT